ncbi:MAG: glycosyltransferase family 2 protein [Candidatus Omnitrophica bacterium]|nr:glycosyltransferase family 2 protein [Candidatus Omnitrophota bacterium]MBU4487670.1 glycosyltransferase family 2 protein [Candidatus Omnitrophota bacterium]MCG2705210.1 glycosyltransferase family 2 protein [Candidatus Omnitrophota bacterium]
MILSVIIPVYNEKATIEEIVRRVKAAEPQDKEIIIVDDCSTDGTRDILKHVESDRIKVILHEKNTGKGGAIRTGLGAAAGDIVMLQDADLEYDPKEIAALIKPIQEGIADAVYGSRFMGGRPQRVHMFWHQVGNRFLTSLFNIMYNCTLTDLETCYKAFKRDLIKDFKIKSNGFTIEPELTAKIFGKHARLYEVPISYYGRSYAEGKKIRFYHGLECIWAIIKFRFVD